MNKITSCFLFRETHRKQHTTWTGISIGIEQHQCCVNTINKVNICSLTLMNMKDLLPKTFTCFKRNNMEIYDSITYVEPFSLPGVQNRKRYWNVTLPSVVWWIVSYYCACWCCWYPKVAPFKCMLSKSRGVLFLSVQKFEALPTGIRFHNWKYELQVYWTASKPWV